jgi:Domain of unknown function (DUF4383)
VARTVPAARSYLVVGGIIYLMLFLCGLVASQETAANFPPINAADGILHLLPGIGMIGLSAAPAAPVPVGSRQRARPSANS